MGRLNLNQFRELLLLQQKIGLDSMCFLYQFTDNPQYEPLTNIIFELLEKNKIQAVTSTISLVEVFVQAEKSKDRLLLAEYEKFFRGMPNLEIVTVDWYIARLAAKLRATYTQVKTPDSLQLSAAFMKNCSAFITNDKKLKNIKELRVMILEDYVQRPSPKTPSTSPE